MRKRNPNTRVDDETGRRRLAAASKGKPVDPVELSQAKKSAFDHYETQAMEAHAEAERDDRDER